MSTLTAAQIATLKTFFDNDSSMATLKQNVGTENEDRVAIQAAFNGASADANPWVWRTKITKHEVTNETSVDGTTFSYSTFIGRSQGERDGWREVWNTSLTCNPSLANVRQAFADIFSGAGGAAQRTHLLAVARRKGSVAERLLAGNTAGGVGTNGSTANPMTMVYEGQIDLEDVVAIIS